MMAVEPQADHQQSKVGDDTEQPNYARKTKFDWFLIAVIGLLVQAFWVWRLTEPTYMDAFYYTTNGQRLATGHGFTELVIWQFLDDPSGFPTPSHTYWMPLPSIMTAAGYKLIDSFTGAQLPFWLLGGLLPVLAYAISWQLYKQRWRAWVAALFTAIGGYYAAIQIQPSTFTPFAWSGALCLFALGLATLPKQPTEGILPFSGWTSTRKRRLWWFIAGFTAGLAHLTRADGIMLLVVGLFIWAIEVWHWSRNFRQHHYGMLHGKLGPWLHLLLLLLGYFLVMGWWFIRNWTILGSPMSMTGTQTIFLTTYADLFAYGRASSLAGFIDWGWQNILRSRLEGIWLGVKIYLALPGFIFLVPFILFAMVDSWRRPVGRRLVRPIVAYTVLQFFTLVIVFTYPGMHGSLLHSSVALWPWTSTLATAGISLTVDWAAARLPHWQPERAKRNFSALFLIMALILTLYVSRHRETPSEDPEMFRRIGDAVSPTSVVMISNPPQMHYYTGLLALSVPNEQVEVVLQAADRYGVTHLVLNENRPLPLDNLYQNEIRHPRLHLVLAFDEVKLYEVANVPK